MKIDGFAETSVAEICEWLNGFIYNAQVAGWRRKEKFSFIWDSARGGIYFNLSNGIFGFANGKYFR